MAKVFTWQGKTESELKELDFQAFLQLVPARQRRSLQRGQTPAQEAFMKRLASGENNIKTHCRNLIVLPQMLGKTIRVHNGKDFVPLTIVPEMLGHYLGEFSLTKKSVSHSSAGVGATRSSKAISAR